LENEVGVSTCVENPKKKGVVRKGPYFANKSCLRALGSGGSDIFEDFCLLNEGVLVYILFKAPPQVY
jgi:hypothetical protein